LFSFALPARTARYPHITRCVIARAKSLKYQTRTPEEIRKSAPAQPNKRIASNGRKTMESKPRTAKARTVFMASDAQNAPEGSRFGWWLGPAVHQAKQGSRQCRTEPRTTLPSCAAARELFRCTS